MQVSTSKRNQQMSDIVGGDRGSATSSGSIMNSGTGILSNKDASSHSLTNYRPVGGYSSNIPMSSSSSLSRERGVMLSNNYSGGMMAANGHKSSLSGMNNSDGSLNSQMEAEPHEIQDIRSTAESCHNTCARLEDVIKQIERQVMNLQREIQDFGGKCWPQTLKVRELQLAALTLESQIPFMLLEDKRDELHMLMRDLNDEEKEEEDENSTTTTESSDKDVIQEDNQNALLISNSKPSTKPSPNVESAYMSEGPNVKQEGESDEVRAATKLTHMSRVEDISSSDEMALLLALPVPSDEEQITASWKTLERVLMAALKPASVRAGQ